MSGIEGFPRATSDRRRDFTFGIPGVTIALNVLHGALALAALDMPNAGVGWTLAFINLGYLRAVRFSLRRVADLETDVKAERIAQLMRTVVLVMTTLIAVRPALHSVHYVVSTLARLAGW